MATPVPQMVPTERLSDLERRVGILERLAVIREGGSIESPAVTASVPNGPFKFGERSRLKQRGVRPELVAVSDLALTITTVDFAFHDGLRNLTQQRTLVSAGKSQTMQSMHLPQSDGLSWAMDLVPINESGQLAWDWNLIYHLVLAVDEAATRLGYANNIVWGGAWDRRLSDFGGDAASYHKVVNDYCDRHPGKDFIDGPHYEWRN